MKAVTIKELKEELNNHSPKELRELCLRLSRFKKENKELLTYLLFESSDELSYIESVKKEIDIQFEQINKKSYYLIKKSVRKILRTINKYTRYSLKKETEVELRIYFCSKLKSLTPSIKKNTGLLNLYNRQITGIKKKLLSLHEDLQFDYGTELSALCSLPPAPRL
jgi:predicted alternative tryptophan synthase beta-subunit